MKSCSSLMREICASLAAVSTVHFSHCSRSLKISSAISSYPDPTAAEAIVKASKKKYLSLVYICSKYSGDVVTNTEAAKRYSRFAVGQDAIPLAPHLLLPLYMKEESERELAMFMDMVLLGRCDELWVFGGEASAGMCAEIAKAKRHGKKIRYFDSLCNETNRALEIGPERLQEER